MRYIKFGKDLAIIADISFKHMKNRDELLDMIMEQIKLQIKYKKGFWSKLGKSNGLMVKIHFFNNGSI